MPKDVCAWFASSLLPMKLAVYFYSITLWPVLTHVTYMYRSISDCIRKICERERFRPSLVSMHTFHQTPCRWIVHFLIIIIAATTLIRETRVRFVAHTCLHIKKMRVLQMWMVSPSLSISLSLSALAPFRINVNGCVYVFLASIRICLLFTIHKCCLGFHLRCAV